MQGLVDLRDIDEALGQSVEEALTVILVCYFSSLKNNGRLHFMAVSDELQRMFCLELKIVDIGVRMKAKLFHKAHMLMLLLDLLFLLEFVTCTCRSP